MENSALLHNNSAALSLYVHVPFCEQKCAYCDFFTLTDPRREHPLYDTWLDICVAEYAMWLRDFPHLAERRIRTIFFGGGTPSLLPPEQFARFIDAVNAAGPGIEPGAEISLETQPATLMTAGDYTAMAAAGINRFSIGVQTLNPDLLAPTGRRHTVEDSEMAVAHARSTGAEVSLDMICSLPGQSPEQWSRELEKVIGLAPDHVSVYEMTYHAGTDYYRQWKRGRITQADDAVRAEMFRHTRDRLTAAGYEHYEISNYAKPGFQSRHNRTYWTLGEFVGLGAGSHSYAGGRRYANSRSARDYAAAITEERLFARPHDADDPDITLVENLQMALRLTEGVWLDWLASALGQDIRSTRAGHLRELQRRGWIAIDNDRIRLTGDGQLYADSVAEFLL